MYGRCYSSGLESGRMWECMASQTPSLMLFSCWEQVIRFIITVWIPPNHKKRLKPSPNLILKWMLYLSTPLENGHQTSKMQVLWEQCVKLLFRNILYKCLLYMSVYMQYFIVQTHDERSLFRCLVLTSPYSNTLELIEKGVRASLGSGVRLGSGIKFKHSSHLSQYLRDMKTMWTCYWKPHVCMCSVGTECWI